MHPRLVVWHLIHGSESSVSQALLLLSKEYSRVGGTPSLFDALVFKPTRFAYSCLSRNASTWPGPKRISLPLGLRAPIANSNPSTAASWNRTHDAHSHNNPLSSFGVTLATWANHADSRVTMYPFVLRSSAVTNSLETLLALFWLLV
jgi:hypothetical protein